MARLPIPAARYYLIAGTIIGTPLALGAVHFPVIVAVGFVVVMTTLSRYLVASTERAGIDPVAIALFVLCVVTALQTLPLPPALLRLISPRSWELQNAALRPLGILERTNWMSISLDRSDTWLEAAKLGIVVLAYQNARDLVVVRSRLRLLKILAVAGICVAVIGILHDLLGAENNIYGLYAAHAAARVAGPFVNGNHQAGFLALTGAAAMGVALESREMRSRLLWGGATLLIGVAGVLAFSRAGTVAVVLAILLPVVRRVLDKRRTPSWLPFAVLAAGFFLVVLASNKLVEVFSDRDTSKLEIWRPTDKYISDFPLTGAGRGTFASVYTAYKALPHPRTFTHAENVPLQMVLDYGVIVGGVIVLAWIYALFKLFFVRKANGIDWAVGSAALALFLQNLLDFNLEGLGVAIPMLSLIAARSTRDPGRHSPSYRVPRPLFLIPISIVATGLVFFGIKQMPRAEARVRQALGSDNSESIALILRSVLQDHPADYFVPLMVADREAGLFSGGRAAGRPLPWLNRVFTLYPRSFVAHRMLARWFRATGRTSQALVEYRLALDCGDKFVEDPPFDLFKEILLAFPRRETIGELTLGHENQAVRLDKLVMVLGELRLDEIADDTDRALLEIEPRNERALLRRAERAQSNGGNLVVLRAIAEALAPINAPEAAYLRGDIALRENRYKDAIANFTTATEAKPSVRRNWTALARAAAVTGDKLLTKDTLDRALLTLLPEEAARMHFEAGWIWKSLNEPATALKEFERAADLGPDWKPPAEEMLKLAEKLERFDLVMKARKHLEGNR